MTKKTYINIFILSLSAYIIYTLAYLRWTYYDAVMSASGLNNTQFGMTLSVFGIVSIICYAPGGWLADRFSARKLLSFSLIVSGLVGFWFLTFPGFTQQIIIYTLWGACCTLTFWSAFQKAIRGLGSSEQQGRLFGLVEGGRGIIATVLSFFMLFVFGKLGEGIGGLKGIVIICNIICFVAATLCWFFLDEEHPKAPAPEKKKDKGNKSSLNDIVKILKTPAVWLIALVIICCYSTYLGTTYLTPYFTNVIKISASASAVISILRTYVIQFAAAPISGFVADKIHSVTKVVVGCYVLMVIGMVGIVICPTSAVTFLIIEMIVLCVAIFACRGIYFATVDEANIPMNIMGTAVGLISVIGFLPDVFISTICGNFLDKYGDIDGYHAIFVMMLGFVVIGMIVSLILMFNNKRKTSE